MEYARMAYYYFTETSDVIQRDPKNYIERESNDKCAVWYRSNLVGESQWERR